MSLRLRPLHTEFGVEVEGVELADADDATFAEVELAAERHSLLLLRGQSLDDDRQLALTRRFGEPEFGHVAYGRDGRIEYIGRIGNVDADGNHLPAQHGDVVFGKGNYLWHTDSSFRPVPTKFSLSHAWEVTPEGGGIEFASMRAAYARLSDTMKCRIEGRVGIHSYVYSRSKVAAVPASLAASLPPVRQRLVRTNPVTGDKNYFVASHLETIEGMETGEARALIDDLTERATGREHVYAHRWEVGDLLVWDNRCLLHRGVAYDADRYRRLMHQTRVVGVASLAE